MTNKSSGLIFCTSTGSQSHGEIVEYLEDLEKPLAATATTVAALTTETTMPTVAATESPVAPRELGRPAPQCTAGNQTLTDPSGHPRRRLLCYGGIYREDSSSDDDVDVLGTFAAGTNESVSGATVASLTTETTMPTVAAAEAAVAPRDRRRHQIFQRYGERSLNREDSSSDDDNMEVWGV